MEIDVASDLVHDGMAMRLSNSALRLTEPDNPPNGGYQCGARAIRVGKPSSWLQGRSEALVFGMRFELLRRESLARIAFEHFGSRARHSDVVAQHERNSPMPDSVSGLVEPGKIGGGVPSGTGREDVSERAAETDAERTGSDRREIGGWLSGYAPSLKTGATSARRTMDMRVGGNACLVKSSVHEDADVVSSDTSVNSNAFATRQGRDCVTSRAVSYMMAFPAGRGRTANAILMARGGNSSANLPGLRIVASYPTQNPTCLWCAGRTALPAFTLYHRNTNALLLPPGP